MHTRLVRLLIPAFCAFLGAATAQQYTISTVAGSGAAGFLDGAALAGAQFNLPGGLAVDSSGKIYVADSANHRIRLISGGSVTTVAGNGNGTYAGDTGAATSASLYSPAAVAVDKSGNLYIADTGNHVIRKVSGGNISTIAGYPSTAGYQGDGGLAVGALLYSPSGVALDSSGNVYLSDSGNNLIRKIDSSGNITAVFGTKGTANALSNPTGIAIDSSGAIYVSDTNNHRVVKWANSKLTIIAGITGSGGYAGDGGPGAKAKLFYPRGVAVDPAGNVYIADSLNNRIRKVTTDGNIATIAGNGKASFSGDGGPAASAALNNPRGVAVDGQGNIDIADSGNQLIRMLQPAATAPPQVSDGGVTNAASYAHQISPGALATVWGQNFGTATATNSAPWSTGFGGLTVTVNGTAAPIYFISPGQINFQVPWETPTGTAQVGITLNGGASNTISVPVVTAGPGLFFSGAAAIAQNAQTPDYLLNGPSNPAAVGTTIVAYLTGSGPVSPAVGTGAITPDTTLVKATSSASAKIGSADAQVQFTGLTPNFIGLVQMNIVVPSGLTPGDYPLTVTINGETSNSANVSVK
jgi:uncharacterized protein (TIGR03437 family)